MMVMEAMASFHILCDDGRSGDRDDNNDCNALAAMLYLQP